MADDKDLEASRRTEIAEAPDELPVVARLVVEIRSDGSHTIARGAMEDVTRGERVAVQAEGTTPLALAMSLAKALTQTLSRAITPAGIARALLSRRRR